MSSDERHSSGFWYADGAEAERHRAVEVLQAVREYRAAEVAMRRRTRETMAMGENDMLVLRYLLKAQREGRRVSPVELARHAGVSTASMTAIIDRLERTNHVRRERHDTDRRSIYVIPTPETDDEVRRTLGGMHQRMMAAVSGLSAEESRVVIETLERLRAAVDEVAPLPDA